MAGANTILKMFLLELFAQFSVYDSSSYDIFVSILSRQIVFIYDEFYSDISYLTKVRWGCRDVMVKAMESGIVVSEFELQSRYYSHFRTLGKI